jgi:hypothetical protein
VQRLWIYRKSRRHAGRIDFPATFPGFFELFIFPAHCGFKLGSIVTPTGESDMETSTRISQSSLYANSAMAHSYVATSVGYDRQHLQKLIDLLDHYDLSDNSSTDNSDLSARLRAFAPF